MTKTTTLRDAPNWRYMLQECDELYRYLPAGGSDKIRTHQRKAREAIARLIRTNAEVCLQPRWTRGGKGPWPQPCVRWTRFHSI
jgi:dimethylpropiothetin dethiomethylase